VPSFISAQRCPRAAAARFVVIALALLAADAGGQDLSQEKGESLTATSEAAAHIAREPAKKDATPSVVVLPIPVSDPTVGTGLTLVGAALYNPNDAVRPWVTGVGAFATSNGSRALGAAQQATLWHDRVRVVGVLGKAALNLKFYGIGSAAGSRDIAIPTEENGTFVLLQALYGVTEHLFVGLRYQDLRIRTELDLQQLSDALGLTLPAIELDHRSTLLGPALDYDTRDNQFAPGHGDYATVRVGFASPRFGSDVSYRSVRGGWAHYWTVDRGLVVAGRVSACAVDGHVPFTELCLYGTSNNLRGYTGGKYRDRYLYTAQAEARWQLARRWGVVAFGGTGAVASTFADLLSTGALPSAGAGVRWLASTQYKVNVSLDVAVGRDGHAVYFGIGEAF
jgi:hypothetical protein